MTEEDKGGYKIVTGEDMRRVEKKWTKMQWHVSLYQCCWPMLSLLALYLLADSIKSKKCLIRASDQCSLSELEMMRNTENGSHAEARLIDSSRWLDGDTESE